VRALLHRHRELCERAVDPLDIAAGLEAHGVTDRTAARFRHRDVFSLAEELYARAPRADTATGSAPQLPARSGAAPGSRGARLAHGMLHLLPGAGCVGGVVAVDLVAAKDPAVRLAVGAAGTLLVVIALLTCLRRGPLRMPVPGGAGSAPLWFCWLLAYALFGDAMLAEMLGGGPDSLWTGSGPGGSAAASVVALAFAVAPAAGLARWFAVRARRQLAASRGLDEFSAAVRPLLLAVVGLFLGALAVLLTSAGLVLGSGSYGVGAPAAALALGGLLFVARLLAVHGRPDAAAAGVAAACTVEALALGTALAARLPGAGALGRPVETAVAAYGPAVVPVTACTTAAVPLLGYAAIALARASAHAADPALR
jgi:hypothetical protein